jgi:hypothetical protein
MTDKYEIAAIQQQFYKIRKFIDYAECELMKKHFPDAIKIAFELEHSIVSIPFQLADEQSERLKDSEALLKHVLNPEVSDTTGDDSSNTADTPNPDPIK